MAAAAVVVAVVAVLLVVTSTIPTTRLRAQAAHPQLLPSLRLVAMTLMHLVSLQNMRPFPNDDLANKPQMVDIKHTWLSGTSRSQPNNNKAVRSRPEHKSMTSRGAHRDGASHSDSISFP